VEISHITRKYVDIAVKATTRDGKPAILTGVDAAVLPLSGTPDAATTWTPATYAAGVATVLIAGPAAAAAGALAVPDGGGDLWLRVTDTPEVDAARVQRITVA
jgi:uncharacterized Zn-binding protein involved in type VI secretion